MSQIRTNLDAKRKKSADLRKRIDKLTLERKALDSEIQQGEGACTHQWEKAKYDPKLETMTRTCEFCGKTEKPRNINFT